jgi:2-keto-4-pentenoate hydratase/2-oxohepta-3-ene-1,7-dioic acid hydratase in catechol pathway
MRLVTFEIQTPLGNTRRLGLWRSPKILDLNLAYSAFLSISEESVFAARLADAILPPDMLRWFQAGERGKQAAKAIDQRWLEGRIDVGVDGRKIVFDEDEVKLLAPLPRPNTIRDFSTYEQHQQRVTRAKGNDHVPDVWYRMPVYWKANPENTIGTGEIIHWPSYSQKLDYELEYGIYIGKSGRNIPMEKAEDYIAGFTIFNDISARDQQEQEMVMTFGPAKGKDFDSAKIFGPCLITPDEFGNQPRTMVARINGEEWSRGSTGGMYWSFAQLISYVSQCETLRPGDFLGSGACPTGCGLEINRWVRPGDTIELEVEGIGILRNQFQKE